MFVPKNIPDDLKELESTPWVKFCREVAEIKRCEFCTNEKHAKSINSVFKNLPIYCGLDCEHRNKNFDGVPLRRKE